MGQITTATRRTTTTTVAVAVASNNNKNIEETRKRKQPGEQFRNKMRMRNVKRNGKRKKTLIHT